MQEDTTLARQIAAVASAATRNVSIDPERVTISKIWNAVFRSARKYVASHSGAGVGITRVAQLILGRADIRGCVPFLINRHNAI